MLSVKSQVNPWNIKAIFAELGEVSDDGKFESIRSLWFEGTAAALFFRLATARGEGVPSADITLADYESLTEAGVPMRRRYGHYGPVDFDWPDGLSLRVKEPAQ